MKVLGIDYGTKRIGIAVSDETASFALPKTVLENGENLLSDLAKIVEEDGIDKIVLGDPGENAILGEVKNFGALLKEHFGLPVILEKEFMTSAHVSQFGVLKPIARQTKKERGPKRDDSAAALILQRYLDKPESRE